MVDVEEDGEVWRQSIRVKLEEELSERVRDALSPLGTGRAKIAVTDSAAARSDTDSGSNREKFEQQLQCAFDMKMSDGDMRHYRRLMRQKIEQSRQQQNQWNGNEQYTSDNHLHRRRGFSNVGLAGIELAALQDLMADSRQKDKERISFTKAAMAAVISGEKVETNTRMTERFTYLANRVATEMWRLTDAERYEFYYTFSKEEYSDVVRTGRLADSSKVEWRGEGRYIDCFGIQRSKEGPFWPPGHGPLFAAPQHHRYVAKDEPLAVLETDESANLQSSQFHGQWPGASRVIYDTKKSSKEQTPFPVPIGLCPSLVFESRFESGNLRQAKRTGHFDYELILNTDLYTTRHTQWYYFRVQNAVPGVTYRFKIINLHKKDSLYNYGMKPLMYSDNSAKLNKIGWVRVGHHIKYYKNSAALFCNLLNKEQNYYTLEWQMEFPSSNDCCYLAHSYPYTFSDLCSDLDVLMADPLRSCHVQRDVLCETKAGNTCYLLTITNFDESSRVRQAKKGIVVSARVHCGESNSSWTMMGLVNYLTGHSATAQELRDKFIFKIVPMLNPDGVIIGNYRCDLSGRDLNRNYRHPRSDNFPTVWHTKVMVEQLIRTHGVVLYCDLHGHSRKQNVFMYGCPRKDILLRGTNENSETVPQHSEEECFLRDRLFPWLMAKRSPERFCFDGCKFQVRKCKEATGRVVMFRQMKILNSFTMETTFCGTVIERKKARHFSTQDFQEMGRTLCDVILQYNDLMVNETKLAGVLTELTSAVAQRILMQRAMQASCEVAVDTSTAEVADGSSNGNTSAIGQFELPKKRGGASEEEELCEHFLTTPSCHSLSDCVQLLRQLDSVHRADETDSSDSDSEPEPEVKIERDEPRKRKKKKSQKKKNKKNGVKDAEIVESVDADEAGFKKPDGQMPVKGHNRFINPYDNRSNGGIPCFTEERIVGRARSRSDMRPRGHKLKAHLSQYIVEDHNQLIRPSASQNSISSLLQRYAGRAPSSAEQENSVDAEGDGVDVKQKSVTSERPITVRRSLPAALPAQPESVHFSPFVHGPSAPLLQNRISRAADYRLAPLTAAGGGVFEPQASLVLTANGISNFYAGNGRQSQYHRGLLSYKDSADNETTVPFVRRVSAAGSSAKDYAELLLNKSFRR